MKHTICFLLNAVGFQINEAESIKYFNQDLQENMLNKFSYFIGVILKKIAI